MMGSWHLIGVMLLNFTSPYQLAADVTPETKEKLLSLADRWEVPQPPADYQVVMVYAYNDDYCLGFADPRNPSQGIVGFVRRDRLRYEEIEEGYPPNALKVEDLDALTLDNIVCDDFFQLEPYSWNVGLIGAIQFFRRGEDQLAFALLAKALATDCGHYHSGLNSLAGERPELMLARACLAARLNELAQPRPDFSKIYRRIKRLLLDEKALQNQVDMSYL